MNEIEEDEEEEDLFIQNDLLLMFLSSNNEIEKENVYDSITKAILNLERNEAYLTKYFNFPIYSLGLPSNSSEVESVSFIEATLIFLKFLEYNCWIVWN
jgi:hypothetical protein